MLLAAVKCLKPIGAVALANGTYVISSAGNSIDGAYGTRGTVPYVGIFATNNGTSQFWTWDGTRLACRRVIDQQVTLNPAQTSANVTLSNGNLRGTSNNTVSAYSSGYGIGGNHETGFSGAMSIGKHYWETVLTGSSIAAGDAAVGIGTSLSVTNDWIGNAAQTIGYYNGGDLWTGGSNVFSSSGLAYLSGAVLCHALDKDNNKYWVRSGISGLWLGGAIGSQNPATNTGGFVLPSALASTTVLPAFTLFNNVTPDRVDGRFTVASWTGVAPVGFGPPSGPPNGPFMADNGDGTVTENATGDTWTILPSGTGYTVRSQTGNYLAIVSGALAMSSTSFVWTFTVAPFGQITFNPSTISIPDNQTVPFTLTTATVTMFDGSTFVGTLTSSDTTFFAISGMNIVLAHNLTSADQGTHTTTITATQGGLSVSIVMGVEL